jgi:hypothetical protein
VGAIAFPPPPLAMIMFGMDHDLPAHAQLGAARETS